MKVTFIKSTSKYCFIASIFLLLFLVLNNTLLAQSDFVPNKIIFRLKNKDILPKNEILYRLQNPKNSDLNNLLPNNLLPKPYNFFLSALQKNQKDFDINAVKPNTRAFLETIFAIDIHSDWTLEEAIKELQKDNAVVYVERIYNNYKTLDLPIFPSDPLVNNPSQYHLGKIRAYQAWDTNTGDPNVWIGITDDAFSVANADLAGNVVMPAGTNWDVADDDNVVSFGSDTHGTTVAMCASAVGNNNVGGVGVAYNCKFIPAKSATDLSIQQGNIQLIAGYTAILKCAMQPKCKVINMSWGRPGEFSQMESNFMKDIVQDYDVVLVAAAGNDNTENLYYPASYKPYVVSVGASDASDLKADFATYNGLIDLVAPGKSILTASTYGVNSGSSFSSPLVAGGAALIRSQFPTWTASQTIARLKTTTDFIDNVIGNEFYAGKLGTGRLNLEKALTAPTKAITVQNITFPSGQRGQIFKGQTRNMLVQFRNHLDALANLQITMTISSPNNFVTVTDGTSNLGAITANTAFNTQNDALTISVASNTPANTPILIKFQYKDGSYTYTEEYRMLVNAGNVSVNELQWAINDQANWAVYNSAFAQTTVITFKGKRMLEQAGLMIATHPDSVSNNVRTLPNSRQTHFTPSNTFFPTNYSTTGNFLQTTAVIEERTNNPKPIGVEITQKTYSWNEPNITRANVLEYELRNLSGKVINNIFAGVYADWDIEDSTKNRADWDAVNQMGYIYRDNSLFGGLVLLTNNPIRGNPTTFYNYFAFRNDTVASQGIPDLINEFTPFEKYVVLSGASFCSPSTGVCAPASRPQAGIQGQGANVSHALSTKFNNFKVGEKRTLAYAIVVGENLLELKNNAQAIRQKYKTLRTAPIPAIATTFSVCRGGTVNLNPTNGTLFNFYNVPPTQNNILPLATANALNFANVLTNQTIYVTNVSDLYESAFVTIQITIQETQAKFNLSPNVDKIFPLTLTNNSANATSYQWKITKQGGQVNADIQFQNNTNAQSQNPEIKFLQTGNYQVRLIARSSNNCVDSLQKNVVVTEDILAISPQIASQIKVYPNPINDNSNQQLFIKIPSEFQNPEKLQFVITDIQGRKIWENNNEINSEINNENQSEETKNLWAFDLHHLPKGMYFLHIQEKNTSQKNNLITKKILKN